jgi:PAS domain S-box-containing protein
MKKAQAAEEQLLEPLTQELFKNLREGIVVVDAQGFITQMNPFAATILNLSPRRIIGQHFRDVFCSTLPLTQCWVQRALRDDLPIRNHQFNMLQANGEPLRLHADFTPIQGTDGSTKGAVITLHELDERDLLLERVAEVRMKQEAILNSIADAVFTVDQEWRIISFNRAAERITGFREQEVLGNYCSKVLNSNACTDNCPLAATLKNNHTIYDYDLKIRRRDREEISVRVNTAILRDANSVPRGGVVSMRKLLTGCGAETSESTFHGIIGQSKAMREVFQLITEIADSTETVLITGESGTGKTILADAIHRASRRRDRPFVKINCSVSPETLLESELFGHVRGAFTGAENNRRGRFLLADRGTIFIDEI